MPIAVPIRMKPSLLAAVALLGVGMGVLSAGCSSGSAEADDDSIAKRIQAGEADKDHPAVGVVHFTTQSFCSATLIAPDLVLTAGHCADANHPIDAFYTGTGAASTSSKTDPGTLGMVRHEVIAQATFPTFDHFRKCPNLALDIALVKLKEPITDIEPATVGRPPTVTAECQAVGFGSHQNDAGATEYFEKRTATATVVEVRETSFDVKVGTGLADHGDGAGDAGDAGDAGLSDRLDASARDGSSGDASCRRRDHPEYGVRRCGA